jgi:hypothetical protein
MQCIIDKMQHDLYDEGEKEVSEKGKEEFEGGIRRSARNKGKKRVKYYEEKNPEAP